MLRARDDCACAECKPDSRASGTERAGRLVAPDQGIGEDEDKELIAEDVGIDGAASSAEEAAVHVVPDDDL